jgi:hypothetical protein
VCALEKSGTKNQLARPKLGNKATSNQSPSISSICEESASKERLRVGNWIVHGLYNYTVKQSLERRLLAVFQHIVNPTRIGAVTDKNSAVTPFHLRPAAANSVFKGDRIEVRGQFNCTMNMPSTRRPALP